MRSKFEKRSILYLSVGGYSETEENNSLTSVVDCVLTGLVKVSERVIQLEKKAIHKVYEELRPLIDFLILP